MGRDEWSITRAKLSVPIEMVLPAAPTVSCGCYTVALVHFSVPEVKENDKKVQHPATM